MLPERMEGVIGGRAGGARRKGGGKSVVAFWHPL